MTVTNSYANKHWVRRWTCCDLTWELMLSKLYPWHETWQPICPKCGGK